VVAVVTNVVDCVVVTVLTTDVVPVEVWVVTSHAPHFPGQSSVMFI